MRLITIGLALSLACGSAALAQAPSSAARCDAEGIPEVAIAACTRMIESGQLRGEKLADALKIRGDVHYNKGDPEGALEDYDRATRINPRLPMIPFVGSNSTQPDPGIKTLTHAWVLPPPTRPSWRDGE